MSWLEVFLTVMSSLIGMEVFAWVAHKYIMHGWGWAWHRDHHEPHDHVLEKNDLFAVVFGTINAAMYIYGSLYWDWLWWFAVGITLYGVIYTLVHDGLVQAHKLHHATIGKEGGVSFGFVIARDPAKLKAELKAQKEAGLAVVRDAAV
jgi:beta-carotene 3-hydroxylase